MSPATEMMRSVGHALRRALSVVFLSLVSTNGNAQIVNTEPLFRAGQGQRWKATAEGNLDIRRGSTELLVLGALVGGRYYSTPHELLVSGAHDRSTEAGEQIANKRFAHVRYRYWFSERLQLEAFAQTAQDQFRLLSARHWWAPVRESSGLAHADFSGRSRRPTCSSTKSSLRASTFRKV
jgi:hypothetical protein